MKKLLVALFACIALVAGLSSAPVGASHWPADACARFYEAYGFYPEGECGNPTTTTTTVAPTTTTTVPPTTSTTLPENYEEMCARWLAYYGYPHRVCPGGADAP